MVYNAAISVFEAADAQTDGGARLGDGFGGYGSFRPFGGLGTLGGHRCRQGRQNDPKKLVLGFLEKPPERVEVLRGKQLQGHGKYQGLLFIQMMGRVFAQAFDLGI